MKHLIRGFVRFASLLTLTLTLNLAAHVTQGQEAHAKARTAVRFTTAPSEQRSALPPIAITVDATEAPRKVLHARLTIPVKPGPLTLFYPKWIPGEHGPTGPIIDLAGLKFTAAGKTVAWRRDEVEMYAFHLEIPVGATALDAALDLLLTGEPEGAFSSTASSTANLVVLNLNQLLLYPEGYGSDDLTYTATLRLPAGWKFATALPLAKEAATINFKPVSLTTFVDSPIIAGSHFRKIRLSAGPPTVDLNIVSDSEAALMMSPEQTANYTQLVIETNKLFGAHHYTHYEFLYTLSDRLSPSGLEHHESSDDRVPERTVIDESVRKSFADLLSHEYVHSWNGKYRRPAGLVTPDYQQPMKGDLLWVYEGLTEYLGSILAARSGLRTPEDQREHLAIIAAYLDRFPGRTWRPLADTAIAAQLLYFASPVWSAWRRGVDYYDEGELIWLEADTVIRQQTKGARSLDDFCRRFYGAPTGPPMVKPYTFDDVVNTMNEVAAYDWRTFFTTRLNSTEPHAPLGGITNGGWRLVYTDVQSEYQKAIEQVKKNADLSYSIGVSLKEDGSVNDIVPGTPAYEAGLGPGMRILAVNGRTYEIERLREALRDARTSRKGLELLVENGEFTRTYQINYHDGERYPHLERDAARPDLLQQIINPLEPRK